MHDEIARFSATGSCVDIFAPGVEILAAVPQLRSTHVTSIMSGTSMATPLVAGVALQIWGMHPEFEPDDVRRALLCTAVHGAIRGVDPHTHNLLLQGGAQLTREPWSRLISAQRENHAEGVPQSRDATECFRGGELEPAPAPVIAPEWGKTYTPRKQDGSALQP